MLIIGSFSAFNAFERAASAAIGLLLKTRTLSAEKPRIRSNLCVNPESNNSNVQLLFGSKLYLHPNSSARGNNLYVIYCCSNQSNKFFWNLTCLKYVIESHF